MTSDWRPPDWSGEPERERDDAPPGYPYGPSQQGGTGQQPSVQAGPPPQYPAQPGPPAQPPYPGQPGYGAQPPYAAPPAQPGYPAGPGYPSGPGYPAGPGYPGDPGYIQPSPPRNSRRGLWLGLGGTAAAALAIAVAVTLVLLSTGQGKACACVKPTPASSHPASAAASPSVSPAPSQGSAPPASLQIVNPAPATAGSLIRDVSAQTAQQHLIHEIRYALEAQFNSTSAGVATVYDEPGTQDPDTGLPKEILYVGINSGQTDPASVLDQFLHEQANGSTNTTFTQTPPGSDGGSAACSVDNFSSGQATECGWATDTTAGILVVPTRDANATQLADTMRQMRPSLEHR